MMRSVRIHWDLEKLRRLVRDDLIAGAYRSVKELALAVGMQPSKLYAILNGYTAMRPETARQLAAFFGVDVSELMRDPSRPVDRATSTQPTSQPPRAVARDALEHEVRLELPLPPSANHRYVRRRDGGLALRPEARDYDAFVLEALGRDRPRVPAQAGVEIHVSLTVDTPRRRDLDNVLKQLLDSLGRCLGFDDQQVVAIKAFKRVVAGADPNVNVIVAWKEIT